MSASKQFIAQHRGDINHFNYYYYTNAFTPEEIIKIREIGDNAPKQAGTVVGDDGHTSTSEYRKSEIAWLSENDDTYWIYEKIADYAKIANR